jgi:transposase
VFIDFLRRLLRDGGGRKVHLIVDGHLVHRAKAVSAWIGRHPDRIELHFLPGHSSELNPVELLNHDVKANAAGPGLLLQPPNDSLCRRLMITLFARRDDN